MAWVGVVGVRSAARSEKLQKELAEMNRKTTTLCVMAVLAMATLALPTPSYPSNAFSGFAEGRVCLKSRYVQIVLAV